MTRKEPEAGADSASGFANYYESYIFIADTPTCNYYILYIIPVKNTP
jgi:hypothetical protein